MGTMLNEKDRAGLVSRLQQLDAGMSPRWGKMTCPKMLAHLTDALLMTYGDMDVPGKWSPMRYFPLNYLIIHVIPFPKGAPTAPQLIARTPGADEAFEQERDRLTALIHRFGDEAERTSWPVHPIFGSMSREDWAVLAFRHSDHHLRQFGV